MTLRAAACRLAVIPVLAVALAAQAETWRGELQGGGAIRVDPDSHRAVLDDGSNRPLWDGVHRMGDGSTVIIRDGIAVPTEEMYRAWGSGPVPQPTFADRYCNQLVRKTCGFDDACGSSAACLRARTLLADESGEQRDLPPAANLYPQTATSALCRTALADPGFNACASLEAAAGKSRCRALVVQACGTRDRCGTSQACDAARQLLAMETDERLANDDPGAASLTGQQCIEAMANPFFVACGGVASGP